MPNRYSADPYSSQFVNGSPQSNGYAGMHQPSWAQNSNQQSSGRQAPKQLGAQSFGQAADEWRQVLTGYMRPSGNPTQKMTSQNAGLTYSAPMSSPVAGTAPRPTPYDTTGTQWQWGYGGAPPSQFQPPNYDPNSWQWGYGGMPPGYQPPVQPPKKFGSANVGLQGQGTLTGGPSTPPNYQPPVPSMPFVDQGPQASMPYVDQSEIPMRVQRVADTFFNGNTRQAQNYLIAKGVL